MRRERSPESRREAVVCFILFLLAFLPYVNTLFANFVYDDIFQVVGNPYVHSFRYLREIFTTTVWSFQGAAGVTNYFRPMMTFGYLLTYQIAGLVPFSFHLVNLILNCVAVWLIFFLLRRFSGERVALIAAGLFALHPIHTESVAWIAAVTDLQLTVFYLGAFLLYLRLADTDHHIRTRIAMCAIFLLALLSKEQAMTLPVMATVFEYFYREDRSATSMREKLSRVGPLWAVAALYLCVRTLILGGVASVVLRPNLSWHDTLLSAVSLIGKYIGKLIWPAHFSAFYVFHPSSHFTDAGVLLGLAGLLVCTIVFGLLWKHAHLLSFTFLLIFLPLGPVLNARWMPASVFGERYLYLPSVGFCWLVGWGAVKLWNAEGPQVLRPLARAIPALVAMIALLYAVRTVTRNRDWASDEVLYRQALESQEDASLIRTDLGAIFYDKERLADAEREWQASLSNGPGNVFALDNMALLRHRQRRYIESLDYSWRALRWRPAFTMAHVNLAETLADMGRHAEAEWQFRIATTLSPLSTRAHNGYGKFLVHAGRTEDARNEYERSVAADSTADAYDQLGKIYLSWQDLPRAEQAFRRSLRVDNFDVVAHVGLGQVLESTGHPLEALHEFEKGLEMNPADPVAKAAVLRLRGNASPKTITQ
jgi:tetratricopeptide (TPR) repeat protein